MSREIRLELVLRARTEEGKPLTVAEAALPLTLRAPQAGPAQTKGDGEADLAGAIEAALAEVSAAALAGPLIRSLRVNGGASEITRSGRTVFYVDVGDMEPGEASRYVESVRDALVLRDGEVIQATRSK